MAGVAAARLLLVAMLPIVVSAAGRDYAGQKILEISFDPAFQPLPYHQLLSLLPFKTGDVLMPGAIRTAIERLYDSGRYEDIIVDAEARGDGVALRFRTEGSWFIGRVRVNGVSEPPNQGQMIGAVELQLGVPFFPEQLVSAEKNLRDILRANGIFEARIGHRLIRDAATQQVDIEFQVDAGPRATYSTPAVEGVPATLIPRIVDETRFKRFRGLLGWKRVTASRTVRGLEGILGYYRNRNHLLSRVGLEEMRYDAVRERAQPFLKIEPGPEVRVEVTGVRISSRRLRQLLPIYKEQSVDRDLLLEGQRNLLSDLENRGYFRAKVAFETIEEPHGGRTVRYATEPGLRYQLQQLTISGHRYFDEKTIRERMNVEPASRFRRRQGRFSAALLDSDIRNIRELYVSNGFREARVAAGVDENFRGHSGRIAVAIEIEEGPQWLVSRMDWAGVGAEHEGEVRSVVSSLPGQPFSETNVAADRDNVLNYYFNRGYLDASFEWTSQPAADPHRMEVRFAVEEGRRVFVRNALIGGLETSNPDMVFDRILIRSGDPLSQADLIETQRRLYDLGVFARVDMALQNPNGAERAKYVVYQFEEARKYSMNFGLGAEVARIGGGVANFDAPAGKPGFSPRVSLGLSRSNMFGIGHTLSVQSRFSNIQQRGLVTYLAPQFKGRENVNLSVTGLVDVSRDIRTFTGRRQEGSIQLGQRFSRVNSLQYRFAYRRVTLDEGSLNISPELIPIFSQPVRVGILSSTFIQDRRDDPLESRHGYYNTIDFGLASKAFGGQTGYLRLLARNSTYHRLKGDVVFARTLILGWQRNLDPEQVNADIPLPERFFSGGTSSHRGFPDNQAGPRDPITGFPLGGSGLLMNNLELRFPLLGDTIGGVLFHDAGNVYSSLGKISFRTIQRNLRDFDYMVHAVGFGIRYRTPIGPIRLDLAYGPNSPRFFGFQGTLEDLIQGRGRQVNQRISRFQFHFSLGQTF